MESLIERYRPRKLADVLGQDEIVRQLELFLKKPHSAAFLFEGGSGCGKTSTALVLAESLGVAVEQDEFGGLWQIASGEQTGETVRRAVENLRVRPWHGSGWKVLIVNEADWMSQNAAYVWLDVLENLPPNTLVIFTTNNAEKIPGRLRDRCERFVFESGGLFMRPAAQRLINRVWLSETGRTDAPDLDSLGAVTDDKGDVSLRRVLQLLTPLIRAKQSAPPMMQQYLDAKARHPGMILLFRMGDFFEAFDEDAKLLSRVLGLTLTSRDKSVPMAGFPHHSLEHHLRKLLADGHRVAVCDQVDELKPAVGERATRIEEPAKPKSTRPRRAHVGSGSLREKVVDAMREGPLSRAELKARLQCEVGSTLTGLLRAGIVVRADNGKYAVASQAAEVGNLA